MHLWVACLLGICGCACFWLSVRRPLMKTDLTILGKTAKSFVSNIFVKVADHENAYNIYEGRYLRSLEW